MIERRSLRTTRGLENGKVRRQRADNRMARVGDDGVMRKTG